MSSETLPSTQPYLLRALHEWCTDNNLTPLLLVKVDGSVQVPPEFVRDGQIVLNISYDATAKLQMGNDYIEFQARFGGVPRQIVVPVTRVMAIYARENGQGMAFPVLPAAAPPAQDAPAPAADAPEAAPGRPGIQLVPASESTDAPGDAPEPPPPPKRPALKRIK